MARTYARYFQRAPGLADDEEEDILTSGTATVLGDARQTAPLPLSGPLPDVPVIDLGPDAEVRIERPQYGLAGDDEDPSFNLFGVQSRPSAASASVPSPLSSPPALRMTPSRVATGRFSAPAPMSIPRVAPHAPADDDAIGPPDTDREITEAVARDPDSILPAGTTVTRADGSTYVVGAPGSVTSPGTARMPTEDDEEIGPADEDADADLSISEPLDPRRRVKLFAPAASSTTQEDAAIRRAEELDRRAARGQRIAAGVSGGLGLLGALTGSDALLGLGQAAAGAGGAINANVRDEVLARQEQRRAREQAGIDRQNADIMAQREIERQDRGDALRESAAASDAAVNEERANLLRAQQAESAFEQEALAGNAEGMRAAIRARAAAVQHVPTRAAWEQRFAQGGPLDQMTDLASLRTILAEVGDTDVRRGGQGAGGSGGGRTRESVEWDPNAGEYVVRTTRTGGQRPAAAPSAPVEAPPVTTATRGPRPAAPQIPQQPAPAAPASTDIAPPAVVDESTEVAWAERVMNAAGIRDRDRREGFIRRLRTGRGNPLHDAAVTDLTAIAGRVEQARDAGMPPEAVDIPVTDWNQYRAYERREITPVWEQRQRANALIRDLRGWTRSRPEALRAAIRLTRDPESRDEISPALLAQADDIKARLAGYINPMLAQRSGAAVTNSEMVRFLRELNLDSTFGNLGAIEGAFRSQMADWESQIESRLATTHPIFAQDWARRQRGSR